MRPHVKFCGNTSLEDLAIGVELGVDALGFLVDLEYASEDALTAEDARQLARGLPSRIERVLVTHATDAARLEELLERTGFDQLQLHGPVPPPVLEHLRRCRPRVRLVKTVHVEGPASVEEAMRWVGLADRLLLDTRVGERLGGTGTPHDWELSRAIRERVEPLPVLLAGGLNPENVARAAFRVRPFGVDVNSGGSARRGVKSRPLARRFLAALEAPG